MDHPIGCLMWRSHSLVQPGTVQPWSHLLRWLGRLGCRGFPTATLFSPQTPPLALPGTAAEAHTVLPLFGAASTSGTTAGGGGGGGGAGGSPGRDDVTALDVADCVCHVGGPVWALAWCPADVGLPAASAAGPSGSSRGASGGTAHYFAVRWGLFEYN